MGGRFTSLVNILERADLRSSKSVWQFLFLGIKLSLMNQIRSVAGLLAILNYPWYSILVENVRGDVSRFRVFFNFVGN